MNKYEKLKQAKSNWYGELKRTIGIDNVKTIQELVERATPKKPINEPAGYFCPTCTTEVYNMTYCANCGQHLQLDVSE